jgi:hypothetical protein
LFDFRPTAPPDSALVKITIQNKLISEDEAMSTVRGAFNPETLAMLSGVFDEACLALTPDQHTPSVRSKLAERILKAAGEGELDPVRLRSYALIDVVSTASRQAS